MRTHRCTTAACGKELGRKTLAKTGDACAKFTDINRASWYHGAVDYAIEHNLFNGITPTTFEPNSKMTRGMFVTVLGRLKGVNVKKSATKFKDVAANSYCSGYVKWASEAGIVNGTSATTFAPDAPVTREQICKMMTEYCNYAGITLKNINKAVTFKDADQISDWAKKYVATCQRAGLVSGSNNKFNPKGEASRAEVAQILMNFSKKY